VTTVNLGLLTPDHANRPVALPQGVVPGPLDAASGNPNYNFHSTNASPHEPVTIVLPDDQLPPGFVPLSPVIPNGSVQSRTEPHQLTNTGPFYVTAPMPQGIAYPRPPMSSPRAADIPTHQNVSNFNTSPAPLNRPLSMFSET
jgi:hypothetical protein